VVEPGETRRSRVSFVSKVTFDKNTGFVANWGSQLPPVVRAAIQAGFDASVAIAKHETARPRSGPRPRAPLRPEASSAPLDSEPSSVGAISSLITPLVPASYRSAILHQA
jgi:hypothetical protein